MTLLVLMLLGQTASTLQRVEALQPHIDRRRAVSVSQDVDAASSRYGVDPQLLVAIVRQESNFRSGIKQCWVHHPRSGTVITCDYGLAQINEFWIGHWHLDADKLLNDDRYNLMVAARILRMLARLYREDEPLNWYGRYHSATPSLRAEYEDKLQPMLVARNP